MQAWPRRLPGTDRKKAGHARPDNGPGHAERLQTLCHDPARSRSMTSQLCIQGRSSCSPPRNLRIDSFSIRSVVAVTELQAEGRVPEDLEHVPEVRPWLDEPSQRCSLADCAGRTSAHSP